MLCWILTGCFLKLKIFKIHSDMSLRWPLVINCVYKPFEATGPMIFKLKIFALYPWLFEVFHIFCLYFVKWVFFFFYLVSQYFLYYPLPMSTASFFFPSWVFSLSFFLCPLGWLLKFVLHVSELFSVSLNSLFFPV